MKNTHVCPKCGSRDVVRVPDHPGRYASGSNIYTSKYTLMGKIPVIRYVCCGCGYVEHWVESPMELVQLHQTFGDRCTSKSWARSFRARLLPKSTENRPGPPLRFCRFCHAAAVDISPGR